MRSQFDIESEIVHLSRRIASGKLDALEMATLLALRTALRWVVDELPSLAADDSCLACGLPIGQHFDDRNQKRSCNWAAWKP